MLSEQLYRPLAQKLVDAERNRQEVVRLTAEHPDLSVEDGYRIQEELVEIKRQQGHRVLAAKMGFTSRAKMKQMNVHEPIYGYIFDYMAVEDGVLDLDQLIHPKVEAEIAFVLGRDIEGPGITGAQVLAATEYVLPALEIIDSRYENFQFTLPDVIADNTSASRVFLGPNLKKPGDLELDLLGVTLSINGQLKDLGAGAAVLGHPAHSVAMLANMLSRKGRKLKKGDLILTGGITGAHQLAEGDVVSAKWDGLGSIDFVVNRPQ
ncbi:2-keto-4-pentenoate hydratase [Brevibacillus humidisoli]|uniref:2-keto-4-pentenoate hydratase n=1 Tax=Brevibacillus humidisoli TaxID=2895522 RepID=UPI001E4BAC90|nr:fumarylacetoacetate hydrolase family protein [Brevibacillus humidisoli]UFJ41101.1 2-keto-4-pentenoate hydratase [Brevibacillus humidisoli]